MTVSAAPDVKRPSRGNSLEFSMSLQGLRARLRVEDLACRGQGLGSSGFGA